MTVDRDQARAAAEDELKLVERLRADPGFFERHAELLLDLRVPHPLHGNAVSLIERQVAEQRRRIKALERRLAEWVAVARDNERLSRQLHALAVALLQAADAAEVVAVIHDRLRADFDADCVALQLAAPVAGAAPWDRAACEAAFPRLWEKDAPLCGALDVTQRRMLFGDQAEEIRSAAVMLLRSPQPLGLLALGSRRRDRFHPALGRVFLEQLAELAAGALAGGRGD